MAKNEDMSAILNRLAGGLVNVILGGLILWVGQMTFRHAGTLAGVEEALDGMHRRFDDVEKRSEETKRWLETAISQMKDDGRLAFTSAKGDTLAGELRQVERRSSDIERQLIERIGATELKLATLAAGLPDNQALDNLRLEVTQLRGQISRQPAAAAAPEAPSQQWQPHEQVARGVPVFLPPVDNRR